MIDRNYINQQEMVNFLIDHFGSAELSKKLKVSRSIVYYWRKGQRNPNYWAGKAIEKLYARTV